MRMYISGKARWELQRKETDIDNTDSQAFAIDILIAQE